MARIEVKSVQPKVASAWVEIERIVKSRPALRIYHISKSTRFFPEFMINTNCGYATRHPRIG
jgi:hypothetical protein